METDIKTQIRDFVREVADRFAPQQIVLFGSHAEGNVTADSDVDLLVVLPHDKRDTAMVIEILQTVRPTFPLDLLVRTPETLAKRIALGDFFLKHIMEKGQTLYIAAPQNNFSNV